MPRVVGIDLMRELANNPPEDLSSVRTQLRCDAIKLIQAENLVEAAYSYNIIPLDRPAAETLHAGGETIHAPRLLPESGELTAIGCGVCTLGPRVEARCTSLFAERRASLALALDEVANEMIFTLSRRIQDRMLAETARRHLTMAGELNAGDPGLDISAQAAILRLAAGNTIGVELYKNKLMTPLKSTSMILGVGKDLPTVSWSRCDSCPSKGKCRFSRGRKSQIPLPTP